VAVGGVPVIVAVGEPRGGVLVGVMVFVAVTVGVGGVVTRSTWMASTIEESAVALKAKSNSPSVTTTVTGTS
jgi:hypothetical protein